MADRSIEEKVRAAGDTALDFVYQEVYGGRGLLDVGIEVIGCDGDVDDAASDEVEGLYKALADIASTELERRRRRGEHKS